VINTRPGPLSLAAHASDSLSLFDDRIPPDNHIEGSSIERYSQVA